MDTEYTLEWQYEDSGKWYPWDSYTTRQEALDTANDPTMDRPERMRLVTTIIEGVADRKVS
jgi:hypothetical protein